MDFWAQHKDFILKILAGVGVFLMALIARNMVYGDELKDEESRNSRLVREIREAELAKPRMIGQFEENAAKLQANARAIADQIGFDGRAADLKRTLIRRILGYLPAYREERTDEQMRNDAVRIEEAIQANLNGGFGQLRLAVRDALVDEASERNIRVEEGVGYENVTELEPEELLKYLLQLELSARLVRYSIDARVDSIEDIRIETRDREEIPGANAEFLVEYPIRIRFRCSLASVVQIVNRLETESPKVPWRAMRMDRMKRPRDHLEVELTVLALASNTDVPFDPVKEEEQ